MSNAPDDFGVHLGLWTNWSRGPVLGRTLTLTQADANLLIAFTSFFISFASTRFWRIVCLGLHRAYSTPHARGQGAFATQRQVILRNSPSAEAGLLSLVRLSYAWRRLAERAVVRNAAPVVLALLTLSAFIVAGGFSAAIASGAGNDVLIDGAQCAMLNFADAQDGTVSADAIVTYGGTRAVNAANYAQQCYSSNRSGVLDCTTFVQKRLGSTLDFEAGCPFRNASLCKSADANVFFDSGFFDSNDHLGLNAPDAERFQSRQTMHCAPLETRGYTSSSTNPETGRNYTAYHYGSKRLGLNATDDDLTYQVPDVDAQYFVDKGTAGFQMLGAEYLLASFAVSPFQGEIAASAEFAPIPGLQSTDRDLHLHFLSGNGVYFIAPTTDPWYHATTDGATAHSRQNAESQTVYRMDEAASPLGCVMQYQFCHGRPDKEHGHGPECGPLAGYNDAIIGAGDVFGPGLDYYLTSELPKSMSKTAEAYNWYSSIWMDKYDNPGSLAMALGTTALISRENYSNGMQGPLPQNQWQSDMLHLWNASLASIQAAFVDTASGSIRVNPDMADYLRGPENEGERAMCHSQKIRSTGFGSFSVLGLSLTYGLGLLIVATSFALEPCLACHLRRRQSKLAADDEGLFRSTYKHLEWCTNETLQQNRLAHEGRGWARSTWTDCTEYVPTTAAGETLGYLDIRDADHPVLYPSSHVHDEEKNQAAATTMTTTTRLPKSPRASIQRLSNPLDLLSPPSPGLHIDEARMLTRPSEELRRTSTSSSENRLPPPYTGSSGSWGTET